MSKKDRFHNILNDCMRATSTTNSKNHVRHKEVTYHNKTLSFGKDGLTVLQNHPIKDSGGSLEKPIRKKSSSMINSDKKLYRKLNQSIITGQAFDNRRKDLLTTPKDSHNKKSSYSMSKNLSTNKITCKTPPAFSSSTRITIPPRRNRITKNLYDSHLSSREPFDLLTSSQVSNKEEKNLKIKNLEMKEQLIHQQIIELKNAKKAIKMKKSNISQNSNMLSGFFELLQKLLQLKTEHAFKNLRDHLETSNFAKAENFRDKILLGKAFNSIKYGPKKAVKIRLHYRNFARIINPIIKSATQRSIASLFTYQLETPKAKNENLKTLTSATRSVNRIKNQYTNERTVSPKSTTRFSRSRNKKIAENHNLVNTTQNNEVQKKVSKFDAKKLPETQINNDCNETRTKTVNYCSNKSVDVIASSQDETTVKMSSKLTGSNENCNENTDNKNGLYYRREINESTIKDITEKYIMDLDKFKLGSISKGSPISNKTADFIFNSMISPKNEIGSPNYKAKLSQQNKAFDKDPTLRESENLLESENKSNFLPKACDPEQKIEQIQTPEHSNVKNEALYNNSANKGSDSYIKIVENLEQKTEQSEPKDFLEKTEIKKDYTNKTDFYRESLESHNQCFDNTNTITKKQDFSISSKNCNNEYETNVLLKDQDKQFSCVSPYSINEKESLCTLSNHRIMSSGKKVVIIPRKVDKTSFPNSIESSEIKTARKLNKIDEVIPNSAKNAKKSNNFVESNKKCLKNSKEKQENIEQIEASNSKNLEKKSAKKITIKSFSNISNIKKTELSSEIPTFRSRNNQNDDDLSFQETEIEVLGMYNKNLKLQVSDRDKVLEFNKINRDRSTKKSVSKNEKIFNKRKISNGELQKDACNQSDACVSKHENQSRSPRSPRYCEKCLHKQDGSQCDDHMQIQHQNPQIIQDGINMMKWTSSLRSPNKLENKNPKSSSVSNQKKITQNTSTSNRMFKTKTPEKVGVSVDKINNNISDKKNLISSQAKKSNKKKAATKTFTNKKIKEELEMKNTTKSIPEDISSSKSKINNSSTKLDNKKHTKNLSFDKNDYKNVAHMKNYSCTSTKKDDDNKSFSTENKSIKRNDKIIKFLDKNKGRFTEENYTSTKSYKDTSNILENLHQTNEYKSLDTRNLNSERKIEKQTLSRSVSSNKKNKLISTEAEKIKAEMKSKIVEEMKSQNKELFDQSKSNMYETENSRKSTTLMDNHTDITPRETFLLKEKSIDPIFQTKDSQIQNIFTTENGHPDISKITDLMNDSFTKTLELQNTREKNIDVHDMSSNTKETTENSYIMTQPNISETSLNQMAENSFAKRQKRMIALQNEWANNNQNKESINQNLSPRISKNSNPKQLNLFKNTISHNTNGSINPPDIVTNGSELFLLSNTSHQQTHAQTQFNSNKDKEFIKIYVNGTLSKVIVNDNLTQSKISAVGNSTYNQSQMNPVQSMTNPQYQANMILENSQNYYSSSKDTFHYSTNNDESIIHQINQSFYNQNKEQFASRDDSAINKDNEKLSKLLTSESVIKNEFKSFKENSNYGNDDIQGNISLILNEIERPIDPDSILKSNNIQLEIAKINTSVFQVEPEINNSENEQEKISINPLFELRQKDYIERSKLSKKKLIFKELANRVIEQKEKEQQIKCISDRIQLNKLYSNWADFRYTDLIVASREFRRINILQKTIIILKRYTEYTKESASYKKSSTKSSARCKK